MIGKQQRAAIRAEQTKQFFAAWHLRILKRTANEMRICAGRVPGGARGPRRPTCLGTKHTKCNMIIFKHLLGWILAYCDTRSGGVGIKLCLAVWQVLDEGNMLIKS